ncbi:MAG: hypothetical protein IPM61_06300 [Chlorobi bacterium]|nr:hypothetical protein [Chlorobiota bacterium]MBX7216795.1 hypothetical protein [Candidatus Kapabacteria bacterium]
MQTCTPSAGECQPVCGNGRNKQGNGAAHEGNGGKGTEEKDGNDAKLLFRGCRFGFQLSEHQAATEEQ